MYVWYLVGERDRGFWGCTSVQHFERAENVCQKRRLALSLSLAALKQFVLGKKIEKELKLCSVFFCVQDACAHDCCGTYRTLSANLRQPVFSSFTRRKMCIVNTTIPVVSARSEGHCWQVCNSRWYSLKVC